MRSGVSGALIGLAGNHLVLALAMTAILCILLGMDVPTTASYILTASVAAPVLARFDLPPLTAHLFIFYFAILSAITPPVCASVYAAATIARESFWKVAKNAMIIANMPSNGLIVRPDSNMLDTVSSAGRGVSAERSTGRIGSKVQYA